MCDQKSKQDTSKFSFAMVKKKQAEVKNQASRRKQANLSKKGSSVGAKVEMNRQRGHAGRADGWKARADA